MQRRAGLPAPFLPHRDRARQEAALRLRGQVSAGSGTGQGRKPRPHRSPLSIPIPVPVSALLAGAVCTASPGWGWLQAPGGGRCRFSSGYLSGQRLRRPPGSAPRSPGYLLPRSPAAALRLRGCCQQPAAAAGNPSGGFPRSDGAVCARVCPRARSPSRCPPAPGAGGSALPRGLVPPGGVWWSLGGGEGGEKGGREAFVGVG